MRKYNIREDKYGITTSNFLLQSKFLQDKVL